VPALGEAEYALGDLNKDNKITAAEARKILRASSRLEQLTDEEKILADFDQDGKITARDARKVLRVSARLDPEKYIKLLAKAEDYGFTKDDNGIIQLFHLDEDIDSLDTGGYTGEWGDSGKLAMLHQKELVLNPVDTSNILAAVDLVRQAAQAIDLSARAS